MNYRFQTPVTTRQSLSGILKLTKADNHFVAGGLPNKAFSRCRY